MDEYDTDFAVDIAIDDIDVECEEVEVEYAESNFGENFEVEDEVEKRKKRRVKIRPQKRARVKDYMCCSLFIVNCCNFLGLGLMAVLCSLQARTRMGKGDVKGAKSCAGHACRTNVAAVLLTVCVIIVFSIFGLPTKLICNK